MPHRLVVAGGIAAVGAAAALGLPELAPVSSGCRRLLDLTDRLPDRRTVALTFDDGPHLEGTPRVLDFLAEMGIRATFFLVGEQVARWPGLAAQVARAGHVIGLHGYEHRTLPGRAARELDDDWNRAVDTIASATGREPTLYRPPRGMFTYRSLAAVRNRGLQPVLWAADGRDWRRSATAASICRRIASRLQGGEVILLHDADHYAAPGSWRDTAAALPLLTGELQVRGLVPVALGAESPGVVGEDCAV